MDLEDKDIIACNNALNIAGFIEFVIFIILIIIAIWGSNVWVYKAMMTDITLFIVTLGIYGVFFDKPMSKINKQKKKNETI